MYLLLVVIFLLCKIEFSGGIIAGRDAEPGEFPFMVSLRNETNQHYCGGSLVSNRHIVTAAHCLFTDRSVFDFEVAEMYEASVIKAVVDTTSIDEFVGEFYQASKLLPHPEYNITNPHSIFHDIGVIELSREITNENVIPIPLPIKSVIHEQPAIVLGWGIDNRDNIKDRSKLSGVLQTAATQVMLRDNCIAVYLEEVPELAFITEALFANTAFCCVEEHVNVCYRDSGSPLIQNGRLAGVVIFGNECKEGSPDIFTSVYHYMDFILDCVEDRCTAVTDFRQIVEHTGL